MFAVFHSMGRMAWSREDWNRSVNTGASSLANILRIHGGMLSGPGALSHLSCNNCFKTPWQLILIELIELFIFVGRVGRVDRSSFVKTLQNCWFNPLAFATGSLVNFPPIFKSGIPTNPALLDFFMYDQNNSLSNMDRMHYQQAHASRSSMVYFFYSPLIKLPKLKRLSKKVSLYDLTFFSCCH